MNVITIIVKTILEIPTVIVKTTSGVPKVIIETGTSGNGCFGAIIGIIFAIMLLFCAVRGCDYVVETYIIKGINPNYETSFEVATKRAEKEKIEEAKKINEIKNILQKNFKLYYGNGGIEVFIVNEKEFIATARVDQDKSILTRTSDGGNTWQILLAGTENRYFGKPSVVYKDGKKIINVLLDMTGILRAQSEDDGKTWEYFDQYNKKTTVIIKNGKIAVYPLY